VGAPSADALVSRIGEGRIEPCYLIHGDRVVAEPVALRLAEAAGAKLGCTPQVHKRPAEIAPFLAELKTYSVVESSKGTVISESAVLAETSAASQLLEEAASALPVQAGEGEPTARERNAALRLFQVLRLFEIDPYAGSTESRIDAIPAWAFGGEGRRAPAKAKLETIRRELGKLLELGRAAQIQGWAESDVEELAAVVHGGQPAGHVLILSESAVAERHPVVVSLGERGALVSVGRVELDRDNQWQGLAGIAEELSRSTGVGISAHAVEELAKRTLRREKGSGFRGGAADGDTTARFAAEYRKLATVATGGRIERDLVEDVGEDRGQEDAWGILDAVGAGRAGDALARLGRLLASADDPIAERLSFFSLLSGFARHVTAISGRLREERLAGGEKHYGKFKAQLAPALQRELSDGRVNPLAGLHPFRLHKAYLAASAMPRERLAGLPARVLETELALKGETRVPDAALAALVAELASR